MKRKSTTQIRVISGNTPQETAMLFNETMTELAELNPTYERDGSIFWIYYTVITEEPETLAERHEAEGERARCLDCMYCMRDLNRFGSIDGRKKWATCGKTGERTNVDSVACDTYYTLSQRERRRF